MRKIIQYIKSLFCVHEWEHLGTSDYYYFEGSSERPYKSIQHWRCIKCGYTTKHKM